MTKHETTSTGIEMGLQYRKSPDDGGGLVVDNFGGTTTTAHELRVKADEMNLYRRDAEATPVFRHVIYEDWQPINHITIEPHPTLRGQIVHKVS